MARYKGKRMEVFFGLIGALFLIIVLPLTAFLTPDYDPLGQMISSLGNGRAKSLFSIGFVVAGSLFIPFYIYLERELVDIKEGVRRLATGIAIVTNVGIALVGIIPDETYIDASLAFHTIVTGVSFLGSSIYIVLYSVLMYQSHKSEMYRGPSFKKNFAYYGFFIGILMPVHIFTQIPLLEWVLIMLMLIWILIAAVQAIAFKFFDIPGIYCKRSEFPEALKLYERAFQVLDQLGMKEEPMAITLQRNIVFIRTRIEKNEKNR
jgi:hypothetical membrane protein